jgi:glycosyltransferase involved in cell wall biosynthesis
MDESSPAPVVTAIIPAFNAAAHVARAVSCALASRGVDLEVLVVDDQSTDDTWQVLESFGNAIRKVRQPKGGPYRARNLGARMARGEWLAFLDSDDEWAPDKIARQLAVADAETDLVYTDRLNIGEAGRVPGRFSDGCTLFEGDIFEPLLLGNFVTLSSVLMRKSSFDRLGGFSEERMGVQDWDLWLRLAAAGGVVKVLREPVTSYRYHHDQMSLNHDARAADRLAVVRRALMTPRGRQVSRRVASQAFAGVWAIGAWQLAPSRRWKAIGWYLRAARHWPWKMDLYRGIVKCCLGRS